LTGKGLRDHIPHKNEPVHLFFFQFRKIINFLLKIQIRIAQKNGVIIHIGHIFDAPDDFRIKLIGDIRHHDPD